jgi:hypothetical protein
MGLHDIAIEVADWLIGSAVAWPTNPPPRKLTDLADEAPELRAALTAVMRPGGAQDPAFKDLGVVLIDFGPSDAMPKPKPRFATSRDTSIRAAIGSLGKIGVLYAAFQLREDVRTALARVVARGVGSPTLNDVKAELRENWKTIPALKPLPIPEIERVFAAPVNVAGAWTIDFDGMDRVGYSPAKDWYTPANPATNRFDLVQALEQLHDLEHDSSKKAEWQEGLLLRSFAERLWLTIRWSDNLAATLCMAEVSANRLGYIKALLKRSGLGDGNDDDAADKGFWLRGAFQEPMRAPGGSAAPPPPGPLNLWEYKKEAQPDGTIKSVKKKWQHSDAASLARLMLALANRTLISPEASEGMLAFLRELNPQRELGRRVHSSSGLSTNPGMESAIENGLPNKPQDAWTKIGIAGSTLADWALIEYSYLPGDSANRRTLGLVVVNGRGDALASNIANFTKKLIAELSTH